MVDSIKISAIRRDGGTQVREAINEDTIQAYAEAMRAGEQFPPVTVYRDGEIYWLSDGFHRVEASSRIGREIVDADVRETYEGEIGLRAAILAACGANAAHGMRRTNVDKRRAVEKLLEDDVWSRNTATWIGEMCGVTKDLVLKLRREAQETVSYDPKEPGEAPRTAPPEYVLGRDGRKHKASDKRKGRKAKPRVSSDSPVSAYDTSSPLSSNPETVSQIWERYPEARTAICQLVIVLAEHRSELKNLILTISHLVGKEQEKYRWKQLSQRAIK